MPASAAASYQVGAWVPWFAEESGAKQALKHINSIDTLYPFVYEVASDGSIVNRVRFTQSHWKNLFRKADARNVEVIPTIAWFDGAAIHTILSDEKKRAAHIAAIVAMVKKERFDGVNIDYESRLAETVDFYSLFLKELKAALGKNLSLTCTIEARTPPESRWRVVPSVINYSNDYKEINKHCDWVEIMAYDQQRADLTLNDVRKGVPYMPVADTAWVKKVLDLALEELDNEKVLLGVATYGRAWDVTVAPEWYRDYKQVASLNQPRILELSKKYNAPIGRTAGGEAVISYFPEDSPWKVLDQLPTIPGTPKGFEAAGKALFAATYLKIEIPVRVVIWSDAAAVAEKITLVNDYDLRGVAIFKVDGEEDPKIWSQF